MKIFEIKHCTELTWDDIPYVEDPVFAHLHIMDTLNYPKQLWMHIQNLHQFIEKEIGVYNPLKNHDYTNNCIKELIGSGQYFNVSRTDKPFSSAFTWHDDETHPHKGFWIDRSNVYWRASAMVKNYLTHIANEWHRLQTLNSYPENNNRNLNDWINETVAVSYAADPFTAKGMNSGYALSSQEKLKYISPVLAQSTIAQVNYLEILDDSLINLKIGINENSIDNIIDNSTETIKYSESSFTNKNIHTYDKLIFNAATKNDIPPPILKGLLMLESSLQARGPDSPVGAAGIAQFMPNTAARYGLSAEDRYIPEKAIPAAAQELKLLYEKFSVYAVSPEDGWRLAMVAYNQGPGSFNKKNSNGAGAAQRLYGAAERLNLGLDRKEWLGKIPYSALTPASATRHHVEMTVGSIGDIGGYSAQFKNDFDLFTER